MFSRERELSHDSIHRECQFLQKEGSHSRLSAAFVFFKKLQVSFCHGGHFLIWLLYGIISDDSMELTEGRGNSLPRRSLSYLDTTALPDVLPREADIKGDMLKTLGESLEKLEIGLWTGDLDNRDSICKFLFHDHDYDCAECAKNTRTFFPRAILFGANTKLKENSLLFDHAVPVFVMRKSDGTHRCHYTITQRGTGSQKLPRICRQVPSRPRLFLVG